MNEITPLPEAAEASSTNRRRWLLGLVAGAAALGGAGVAWRNYQPQAITQNAESGLWESQFATTDGGMLSMASLRGKPLLLNFWATWCPPCIEELPLLNAFYRENVAKGWQVLGLAVDQLGPVKQFLAQAPVSFPVALAGLAGVEVSKALGNVAGGLPFTVVLKSDGTVAHRKMGKITPDNLRSWALLR